MLVIVVDGNLLLEWLSVSSPLLLVSVQSVELVVQLLLSIVMHSQYLESFGLELFHIDFPQLFSLFKSYLF